MAKLSGCSDSNIIVEDSQCARCIHFRRLLIPEMKTCFRLKCAAADKYMKSPRKSCTLFEPETWEKFLEIGDNNEN